MIKLIEVGENLKIVRSQPRDPASTSPFPDGLNKTQLQLSDELKEVLALQAPELDGVSKDIQLVADVSKIEGAGLFQARYDFSNTLAQSFNIDIGPKRYFSIQQIAFVCFNTTANPEDFEISITVDPGVGAPTNPDQQLLLNTAGAAPPINTTIAANENLIGTIQITGTAAQATAVASGFSSAPSGTFLSAWLINVPTALFEAAELNITLSAADPGVGGSIYLTTQFHDQINQVF